MPDPTPGVALARGASLGASASAVMYLVLNFIAPPARVGRDGVGKSGASYSYSTAPSTAAPGSRVGLRRCCLPGITWGQYGDNPGATCGQSGVNLGSIWGQPGVNPGACHIIERVELSLLRHVACFDVASQHLPSLTLGSSPPTAPSMWTTSSRASSPNPW